MAYKYREEIVGKRFLSVSGFTKLKLGKITEWGWRAGVIRAASHKDNKHKDLQVLVEYDDVEWHRREWISIYKDSLFHFFLVEQGLVWSERRDPFSSNQTSTVVWPALKFMPLVSTVDLSAQAQPVEFLLDRELAFKDYTRLQPFQEWDPELAGVRDYPELRAEVRRWAELQDGQRILLTTPSVLVGYRVEVYRAEGTTQWYTAVIVGYNEATRDLTVTDDTVLEEHNEDPSLVQMRLIGDGVVESIMRGENVGITPRRSRSALLQTHHHHQPPSTRVSRGSSGLTGSGTTNNAASRNLHNSSNQATSIAHRKQRSTRPSSIHHVADHLPQQQQQQPPLTQQSDLDNKGTILKTQRKRKSSENETINVSKPRTTNSSYSNKEDLENKQGRKRNTYNRGAKKKVLEEANNSKLRHVQVRVEDCLQNGQRPGTLSAICRRQSSESVSEPLLEEEDTTSHEPPTLLLPSSVTVVPEDISISNTTTTPLLDDTSNSSSVQLVQLDEEDLEVEAERIRKAVVNVVEDDDDSGSTQRVCSILPAVIETVSEEDDCIIVTEEEEAATATQIQSRTGVLIESSTTSGNNNSASATTVNNSNCSHNNNNNSTSEISNSTATNNSASVVVVDHSVGGAGDSERGASVLLRECDDDGPLSSSSPFSRMELSDGSGTSLLRFPDDRSDSGVSSLRSGSCASGDERSGSRSSALSSSDEPHGQPSSSSNNNNNNNRSPLFVPTASATAAAAAAAATEAVRVWRDPSLLLESEPHVRHIHSVQHQSLLMSHPAVSASSAQSPAAAAVATSTPAAPTPVHYPGVVPPPPPLLTHPLHHHPAVPPHHLPPPNIYSQLPEMLWNKRYPPLTVGAAHMLGPQAAHPVAEELIEREQRAAYAQDRHDRLLRREQEVREMEKQQHKEREKERERIERERERQEREKIEREREKQVERERQDRLEREQERERQEKQRQEQAVHKHFEESLRLAHQKQFVDSLQRERNTNVTWNLISLPPPARGSAVDAASVENERKRIEHEYQREQHRQMVSSERLRTEQRERERAFYAMANQRPPSVPTKAEYPPPAHSRVSGPMKNEKMSSSSHHTSLPKAEPNFSIFGAYPGYQPNNFVPHDAKVKMEQHHKQSSSQQQQQQQQPNSLIVNKGGSSGMMSSDRDRDLVLSNPPPLISEMKSSSNSVIVKHEVKSPHHLEAKVSVAHSPSPKLRGQPDMMSHYIPTTTTQQQQQHKSGLYEYRSPTQSPHHLQHPHTPSPHHHIEPQNLKSHQQQQQQSHHRSSSQLPSPHSLHQRQSPHMHSQNALPSNQDGRYSRTDVQMYQNAGVAVKSSVPSAYGYLPPATIGTTASSHYALAVGTSAGSNSKPKVSSPAPPHIYGKPNAGIGTGIPVCRVQEVTSPSNPIQLTSKPPLPSSVSPSPYQQVSQYHPPHPHQQTISACPPPPPAHSSRTTTSLDPRAMYERSMYVGGPVPGAKSLTHQQQQHHGTSPPTASAAPSPISRSPHLTHNMSMSMHHQHSPANIPAVQTQPLDLGVTSDRNSNRDNLTPSPKRKGTPLSHPSAGPMPLDVKKRRIDSPGIVVQSSQHPATNAPQSLLQHTTQPQLARVSEPSPLIASAATTITTVVNTAAYRTPANTIIITQSHPAHTDTLSDVNVSTVPVQSTTHQIDSINQRVPMTYSTTSTSPPVSVSLSVTVASTTNSPVTSAIAPVVSSAPPSVVHETPTTPIKVSLTPSVIDSEKSNSPGPTKSTTNYPVRHLKKAWLQRHTGEDVEDTTGVTGSGSCVTLPIPNINNTTSHIQTKETTTNSIPVTSLHNIGSMAINSINKSKSLSSKTNARKGNSSKEVSTLNGHTNEANKGDDSSSSDPERGRKSPPKRKPPKVKRKKGGGGGIKKSTAEDLKKQRKVTPVPSTVASESGSESEKESGSEKDSDSGASTNQASSGGGGGGGGGVGGKKTTNGGASLNASANNTASKDKEPRKRGRRPKSSKNDKGEEPRNKKSRDEPSLPQRDPFRKPPVGQLKKTGESFLQDGPCFEVAPKLAKCRECRWTPNQRSKNMPNIFCRFYAFRRLRYTKNGQLAIAGFSDPHKDPSEEDLKLWLPYPDNPPSDLDLEMSRLLLLQVGDHFCDLLVQEREALAEHMSDDKIIAWKRVVQGVREMCDVCETTLFNFHWACGKCGFVVCLDCYKGRKTGSVKIWGEPGKDRDEFSWLQCTNRQPHEQEKLMLTQIIAGDSLLKLGKRAHEFRELWSIPQFCGCPLSKESKSYNGNNYRDIIKTLVKSELNGNGVKIERKDNNDDGEKVTVNGTTTVKEEKKSPLSWLADVALSNEDKKQHEECSSDSDAEKDGNFSTLRELLIRPSHKSNGSRAPSPAAAAAANTGGGGGATPNNNGLAKTSKKTRMETLDEVISSVIEDTVHKTDELLQNVKQMELKHFVRRYNWHTKGREQLPIRIMTLTESKILYPNTPHSWLCDGKLLRITDPNNQGNYRLFQDQWKRGQPVIVSDVTRALDMDLWHPDAFIRDFGDEKNDLINCMTGKLVPNQPMSKFWEGFEHFSKRLKDERGNPMLLKLKDWPPGEDFAELMPSRFTDLMRVLPLSEYTHRTGRLNLASRLPECFVRPDLGPKMYNAYGSALYPTKGTTNLHLDISDAVNVMVYVGIPKDGDNDEHIKEAFRAIDEAGCDILTRRRVRDKGELPGALWHIYNARDADKIRDLLNKVALEKGDRLEPHHDPIHDQSGYLDGPLRERLYKEYGVEGYAIVQCLGDAVFIPAGAPHQVRNLHNCIKVAEDFVSPENVSHCFHLTQEFRELSDTHSNHEDKLQIKNIIYHTVKDSLSVLSNLLKNNAAKPEVEDSLLLDGCIGSNGGAGGGGAAAQIQHCAAGSGASSSSNSPTGSPVSQDTDSKETA